MVRRDVTNVCTMRDLAKIFSDMNLGTLLGHVLEYSDSTGFDERYIIGSSRGYSEGRGSNLNQGPYVGFEDTISFSISKKARETYEWGNTEIVMPRRIYSFSQNGDLDLPFGTHSAQKRTLLVGKASILKSLEHKDADPIVRAVMQYENRHMVDAENDLAV